MSDLAARAAELAGARLVEAKRLAGGSLSEVVRLKLADGRELIAKSGPTAAAEADMLRAIAATGAPAPQVIGVDEGLLVMAAVPDDGSLGGAWDALGTALARLHAPRREAYGWPLDHAFGKVAIVNARSDDWPVFWGAHRIACHAPHVDGTLARRLERLAARLGEILPGHPAAALLHGDLWSGNVLAGADGRVTLIDPACYFGDREVDVAMLTLFGSPPAAFLESLGLETGWRERLPAYQLWPLLVHLRLFGSGYAAQVAAALGRLGF